MEDMPRGRPRQETDKELITAGRDSPGPCFTAGEVADKTSIAKAAARVRLDNLVEDGVLQVKNPGGEKIYWIVSGAD